MCWEVKQWLYYPFKILNRIFFLLESFTSFNHKHLQNLKLFQQQFIDAIPFLLLLFQASQSTPLCSLLTLVLIVHPLLRLL
uniref:Uncharacterized protein n=1 Tax=Sinocyclocheilus grahami TaxID=75366 RepID=A0A672R314_SINGR